MSSSIEAEIWGERAASARSESVRDRLSMAQPVPENFYERCAHGISGDRCDVCRAIRERGAAEPAPTPTASQTVVAQAMPFLSGITTVPAPEAEPPSEIVAMAQEFAAATQRLQREQNLLVAAELRVESLKESIAQLRDAAEEARKKIATYVTEEK